jgi:hypothetical protein
VNFQVIAYCFSPPGRARQTHHLEMRILRCALQGAAGAQLGTIAPEDDREVVESMRLVCSGCHQDLLEAETC